MPLFLILLLLAALAIGIVIGVFLGFSSIDFKTKSEIRKRMTSRKYNEKPLNTLAECREELRNIVQGVSMGIIAPILDTAGVATEEEFKFVAELLDISEHGACILSKHFLTPGITIHVQCVDTDLHFPLVPAQIRHISLAERGIKLHLQFYKPIIIPPQIRRKAQ